MDPMEKSKKDWDAFGEFRSRKETRAMGRLPQLNKRAKIITRNLRSAKQVG